MDSLDAQCFVAHTILEGDPRALPPLWAHRRDGLLSMKFAGSPNDFTWRAEQVAEVAGRWHALGEPVPEPLTDVVAAHRDFAAVLDHAEDLERPDWMVHDLDREEVRALWTDAKLCVIVEEIGEASDVERLLSELRAA